MSETPNKSTAYDCKWPIPKAKQVTARANSAASLSEDALYALLSRPGDDLLDDKPNTMAQGLAMSLMRDAIFSTDADILAEARSEIIDRTDRKAVQAVEHSGQIARTHEEELAALDNLESDDATREADTPASES